MTNLIREFSGGLAPELKPASSDMVFDKQSPPEVLSQLMLLGNLKTGFGDYYVALLNESDEVLSTGAACALLDSGFVPPSIVPRVKQLAGIQSVRTKAFDYFMAN